MSGLAGKGRNNVGFSRAGPGAPERRRRQKGRHDRWLLPPLDRDHDVVEDRQVTEEADVLERPANPEPRDAVGGRTRDILSVEADRPARRPKEPGEEVEQRRL